MTVATRTHPILYVDDEPANLLAVQYAFEGILPVEIASSGEEALKMLGERRFSVLLTDQRMPGMSGVELCAHVRDRHPDVVRIILTAYADLHSAVDAVNRGQVLRYVAKPVSNEELEEVLRTALDAHEATRAMRELQERALRATPARAVSRRLAVQLAEPLRRLRSSLAHGGDLVVALQRTEDPTRREALLGELRHAREDAEREVMQLEEMRLRLDAELVPDAAPPPAVDLARLAEGAVRLRRAKLDPAIRIALSVEGTPRAFVEASLFGQVIDALLDNAVAALSRKGGGRIEVVVGESEDTGWVTVRDDGPGIPEPARLRVFDPGFSLHGGAGFGLARARERVESAGGALDLERSTEGTSFVLHLPLADRMEDRSGEYPKRRTA
ncbi:MAG: hybrid sensor histidine kinase/response regulator [Sandaracinus sp.]|nr:hybrid sensor histidine kinase/response regulator [Myxococcales bacterium]MCB9604365.1 hybrid sensor histidine kinase/response regulator [Sandaracinus sp.]MCB9615492.1 hybrid sensor histidine kinase/response regulator [Sandaracinus sp.]